MIEKNVENVEKLETFVLDFSLRKSVTVPTEVYEAALAL